jgi:hypothetical protein
MDGFPEPTELPMLDLDISAIADLALDLDIDLGVDLNLNANLDTVSVKHVISDWVDLSANTAYLRGSADAFGENTLVNVEFDVVTTDNLSSISVSVISVTD